MTATRVRVAKSEIIKGIRSFVPSIDSTYYSDRLPDFIELDAEVVEEKMIGECIFYPKNGEHCSKCNVPLGMSNPPSYTCFNSCPCHSKKENHHICGRYPVDLGKNVECMNCKSRYCWCVERNLDGSIKKPDPAKKLKRMSPPWRESFVFPESIISHPTQHEIVDKINELVDLLNGE